MAPPSNQADVPEADLLLPFELSSLEGDYREYQKTRRNNCFASMQRFPDLWKTFAQLDACWRAGLDDMRRITSADDMLPLSLYIRAHAQTRTSGDLLFSGCLPEAADLLRTGVEYAVHAYRIKEDPSLAVVWLQKDDAAGRRAYAEAFEKEKKARLFKGLGELHHFYAKFSEWSHATVTSLALKSEFTESAGDLNFLHQYFETDPKRLRHFITLALDASAAMENIFFKSFSPRLELDVAHLRRRHQLLVTLQSVRRKAGGWLATRRPPS
jgi:hypothetical protein